jgi:RNA polymerase sigma factor (sigma-70 family)
MLEAVFATAYPLARRAAEVRSAAVMSSNDPIIVDREDLEQEAMVGLWRALSQFDSSRASLRTFVERVIATKIASALRAQRVLRRVPASGGQPLCLGQPTLSVDLRRDVERVLAVLSDGDRRLAVLLGEHTPTEASRKLRVSRSTVYEGIRRIRIAFVDAGLGPDSARRS